jgi:hypothetical protein
LSEDLVRKRSGKGRGYLFFWLAAQPKKGAAAPKDLPPAFEAGDWEPIDRWMRENGGSVPAGQVFIFDENGRNVSVADLECCHIYYTMYKASKAVPACPARLTVRRLIATSKLRALRAAERVRRRCRLEPACDAVIRLQVRAWGCNAFGVRINGQFVQLGNEAWAAHCYRIECIET